MEGSVQNFAPSYLDVPYDERWELFKPYLEQLYIQEKRKLSEVVEIMRRRHVFDASESQYKRQFSVWGLKKNIPTPKKTAICETIHTRAQMGKSSLVKYKGQDVDPEKMRRLLKTKRRQEISLEPIMGAGYRDIETLSGHALQCGNRIFMNWNMPHIPTRVPKAKAYDHLSPFGPAVMTPASDIIVKTPSSANTGPSPRDATSPRDASSPKNAPSPMTVAVRENIKIDRARLFVQGNHMELLKGLSREEKITMTNWLHHFWLFSYKTARTWGRGPRKWTSSMLGFDDHLERTVSNLPNSPGITSGSPANGDANRHDTLERQDTHLPKPTPFFQWSIHIKKVYYERIASPTLPEPEEVDLGTERTWTPWPETPSINELADTLQTNLKSNDFSSINVKDLPISATQVIKAAKRSPEKLLEEAFGFSIMGRNINLIYNVINQGNLERLAAGGLFPLHLAASYLDGGKTCCMVFNSLAAHMPVGEASVRKLYINHLNHTVLDNLIMAILKAHTSCSPSVVDDAFKKESRFVGEEVDICGRWDADSSCVRALLASGISNIPFEWKHMFCHTSVQAICHCIGELFGPRWGPDINMSSGIFVKRCPNETCGLKLQLMPLHTLVVTAVHLASQGSVGENLFGMLACLLCLLRHGANPLLTASVSLDSLLGSDDGSECSHEELDPLELAQKVPVHLICRWSSEANTGWQLFCHVLKLSQAEWQPKRPQREKSKATDSHNELGEFIHDRDSENAMVIDDTDPEDEDSQSSFPRECGYHGSKCYFRNSRDLLTLWAAVQTEFLTYRRLGEEDAWISSNFNMESLLESLTSGNELSINLVQQNMMKDFCSCGSWEQGNETCPIIEDVCNYYFSNLEDWHRSNFLEMPFHGSWYEYDWDDGV